MNGVACLSFYHLKAVLILVLLDPVLKHLGKVSGSWVPNVCCLECLSCAVT